MPEKISIRKTEAGVVLQIKVLPRSSRYEIAGVQDGALRIKITAPPVEGKANEECIRYLSDVLGVKRTQVTIIGGYKARLKTVAVNGVTAEDIIKLVDQIS